MSCWIVLLLAAFGCVQYLRQGAVPYLLGGLVVIVVSAACILRQGWARQPMRVVALLLALWAVASGVMMLMHWGQFEQARQQAVARTEAGGLMLVLIEQARRAYLLGLVLKALLLPLLLWLAWRLGRPNVAMQFRTRGRPA